MVKTYHVALKQDGTLDWGADGPPMIPAATTVAIELPTQEQDKPTMTLREAFEKLASRGTFSSIADPVEWQREIRKDRPLPGRVE